MSIHLHRTRTSAPAPCTPRVPLTADQLFVRRIQLDWYGDNAAPIARPILVSF